MNSFSYYKGNQETIIEIVINIVSYKLNLISIDVNRDGQMFIIALGHIILSGVLYPPLYNTMYGIFV